MRPLLAGGSDSAFHHRPVPLRRRARACDRHHRRGHRRGEGARVRPLGRRPDRVAVAGPAAAPRCNRCQACQRPGAEQSVAGPAGSGDPADRRHGRDRRGITAAQKAGGSLADRGRVRHLAASRLSRRIRLRPELEAGRRFPGDLRLDQRDQTRARPAAPRVGRRSAQPDPAVGPQRARGPRSGSHPVRRRGARRQTDRPVGRLHRQPDDDRAHRRRQTRRLPVAGASPARRRFDELEKWLDWYTKWSRTAGATAQSERG